MQSPQRGVEDGIIALEREQRRLRFCEEELRLQLQIILQEQELNQGQLARLQSMERPQEDAGEVSLEQAQLQSLGPGRARYTDKVRTPW